MKNIVIIAMLAGGIMTSVINTYAQEEENTNGYIKENII